MWEEDEHHSARHRAARRAGIVWLCVLVTLGDAFAAGIWTRPGGGMTYVLAVDPSQRGTIYAGTGRGGIFESTDAGKSWRRLTRSRRPRRIRALVADGTGRIYASDADGRLLERAKGDERWRVVDVG